MSIFRTIDPPPYHRPASLYPPPPFGAGVGHTRWVERGTPDTALNGKALPVEVEEEGWGQAAGLYSSPTA
jgi:hypothetical protein